VYSLDWSAQVFAGNKLPGIWDTKITELQFMLSPQYLKEIYDNVDQASLEWSSHRPFDTMVRDFCVAPAIAHVYVAFKLICDCVYDPETRFYSRDSARILFPHAMCYKFWMNQTGCGLVQDHPYWHRVECYATGNFLSTKIQEDVNQFIKDIDAYEAARRNNMPGVSAQPHPIHFDAGWTNLVDAMMDELFAVEPDIKINLVKQKFGELRVYTSSKAECVYAIIEEARKQSLKTCEICGKPGSVRVRGGGIKKTVCSECLTKV